MSKLAQHYPKASQKHLGAVKTVADFIPQGVTVHYTADPTVDAAVAALKDRGLGYHLIIDRDGTAYQCAPFDKFVWHAGDAMWNGLSPNRTHLAVSLVSWGLLTKLATGAFESWNGRLVATADVVERRGGAWHAATTAQETALLDFLVWTCLNPQNICGHDECALPKGRKVDPGGVLALTMPSLRQVLPWVKPSV